MVIPVEKRMQASPDVKTKKYIGNNMVLDLVGKKRRSFLIVGSNCSVQIKENLSSIKIVGDNCTVRVASGGGSVVYIGNNGAVHLDQGVAEDLVTYVGKNGLVSSTAGAIRRRCSDGDVRNCGSSATVVHLDGQADVSVASAKTKVKVKKLTKIPSTISLPNIQVHLLA